MRNFKIIEIRVIDGSHRLVADRLQEMQAWRVCDRLERAEAAQPGRRFWYAVTNSSDWQSMAVAFYRMRSEVKVL